MTSTPGAGPSKSRSPKKQKTNNAGPDLRQQECSSCELAWPWVIFGRQMDGTRDLHEHICLRCLGQEEVKWRLNIQQMKATITKARKRRERSDTSSISVPIIIIDDDDEPTPTTASLITPHSATENHILSTRSIIHQVGKKTGAQNANRQEASGSGTQPPTSARARHYPPNVTQPHAGPSSQAPAAVPYGTYNGQSYVFSHPSQAGPAAMQHVHPDVLYHATPSFQQQLQHVQQQLPHQFQYIQQQLPQQLQPLQPRPNTQHLRPMQHQIQQQPQQPQPPHQQFQHYPQAIQAAQYAQHVGADQIALVHMAEPARAIAWLEMNYVAYPGAPPIRQTDLNDHYRTSLGPFIVDNQQGGLLGGRDFMMVAARLYEFQGVRLDKQTFTVMGLWRRLG